MRLIFVLLLMSFATCAHASVCDQFPRSISQSNAEDIAGQVKDAFPAKYRPALDKVRIRVSPQSNLYLDESRTVGRQNSSQITISTGYEHDLCVLMMATVPLDANTPPVTDQFTFPASECARGQDRFTCLIQYLEKTNARRESIGGAKANLSRYAVAIRATLKTALLYGLAHEYGHVVERIDPNLIPFQQQTDQEFVADVAALYVITSNEAPSVADGLYFGGLRVLELANLSVGEFSDSHEPTICRAIRTNEFRKQALPSLNKIYLWLNEGADEGYFGGTAVKSQIVQFAFENRGKIPCANGLPQGLQAAVDDIRRLGTMVSGFPDSEHLTVGQVAQLETFKPNTGFGRSFQRGLLMEAIFAQPGALKTLKSGSEAAKVQLFNWIIGNKQFQDIPSEGYVEVVAGWATGRFGTHPRGYSFRQAAHQLDADLSVTSGEGSYNLIYVEIAGVSDVANGRCNEGVRKFAKIGQIIDETKSNFQPTYPGEKQIFPKLLPYVAESIGPATNVVASGEILPTKMCEAMRVELADSFKKNLGWVD